VSFVSLLIDAQWAVPLNTVLLIVLAIVNTYRNKKTNHRVDLVSQHAADAKNKCGAIRRGEDKEFIQEVKGTVPIDHVPNIPKRFTDTEE
jgi:hypothetical protein